MKKFVTYAFFGALATPLFVSAQAGGEAEVDLGFFNSLLQGLGELIDIAIPLLIALAILLFIWGLVVFIFAQGDDDAKKQGRSLMVWGVIALFVIVSVWGLVALLNQITGVDQGTGFTPPETGLGS
jgi:hypothetical protein